MSAATLSRSAKAISLVVALLLTGCEQRQTLYTGLSQTEANEMLSLLYASELQADKRATEDDAYTVSTPQASFSEAMALLQAHGLPGDDFESMGDVFAKESFVSSHIEERARLNFALSQELARTIADIDGVVRARVHLVLPERERLRRRAGPASASVYIRHRADVDLSRERSKIKSMVINGVENLPYRNVSIALFETRPPAHRVTDPSATSVRQRDPTALSVAAAATREPLVLMPLLASLLATLLLGLFAARRFPGGGRLISPGASDTDTPGGTGSRGVVS